MKQCKSFRRQAAKRGKTGGDGRDPGGKGTVKVSDRSSERDPLLKNWRRKGFGPISLPTFTVRCGGLYTPPVIYINTSSLLEQFTIACMAPVQYSHD